MDQQDLITAARLERERAQKAQYTAMMLRQWSAATRERHRTLRCAAEAQRDFSPPRPLLDAILVLLSRQLPERAAAL